MNENSVDAGLTARRKVLRDSTDARAMRTRREIASALERLAEAGVEITVSSIVREVGVSRGTFYTHYSGLEDLALELQAEVVHSLAGMERARAHLDPEELVRSRRESISEALGGVVEHYAKYRTFYVAVFSVPVSQAAMTRRVEALAAELQKHMEIDAVVPEGVDIRIASLFIAGGWTTILVDWVLGNLVADGEQVTRHMVSLVPEWLYRLRASADLQVPYPTSDGDV